MSYEKPRHEIAYWRRSKDIFLEGIDKNKTLPDNFKDDLKQLVGKQFQFLGEVIATAELMYLRQKQHKE